MQANRWNADTASYEAGAYWYDAAQGDYGAQTGGFSLNLASHADVGSVMVLGRDIHTGTALVLDTGSYLSLTNWGVKDSLYIDTPYGELNNVDEDQVTFVNGLEPGVTTLQFGSNTLGGAGVDFTLAPSFEQSVVSSFAARDDPTSFLHLLGSEAKPVIAG